MVSMPTVNVAINHLQTEPEALDGLWYSDGNDAGEFNPNPTSEPAF